MSSHVYVRPLCGLDSESGASDRELARQALAASNRFFPREVFSLPTTRLMVAEDADGVVAWQPQYISLVLGSIIAADGVSPAKLASAQHQFTAAAFTRANTESLADILCFSSTPETLAFAQRHGYQKTHEALRLEVR